MSRLRRRPRRSGHVIVTTILLMFSLLVVTALAVDVGYIHVATAELQRTADSSAIAAAWKLMDQEVPGHSVDSTALNNVRDMAGQFAALNRVTNSPPSLDGDDVTIGQLGYPYNGTVGMTFAAPNQFNAVQVRVRRTPEQNGAVNLFFARVMGIDTCNLEAGATALFLNNIAGFHTPANGRNVDILPFALDVETWNDLMAKTEAHAGGVDDYAYNSDTHQVTAGHDGIFEVNLYPQGTGSPGNRGTVDIGSSNNSTADISRQIRYGISPGDFAQLGKPLEFDSHGELQLNGDTGISAGVKDDLASIIGRPRCIPIFSSVAGPGNNAQYTIVKFVGVRVLNVKLTGSMSSKKLIIQPCSIICPGAIRSSNPTPQSQYVYSPVWLVK